MVDTTHVLSLSLAGTAAAGFPEFSIYVNGVQIAQNVAVLANYTNGQWATYNFTYSSSQSADTINVVYNNDHIDTATGADRNLYVDSVTLDGNSFQAALAPGAVAAIGNQGATTSAALYTNGSLTLTSNLFKPVTPGTLPYLGVNYSGAEFSNTTLSSWNQAVSFPTNATVDYYASKGLNIIRLPVLWEQLQPTKDGALNQSYLHQIESVISYAATKGMTVVVDPHNFGQAYGGVVGESSTTNADFANFWGKLAGALKTNSNVMFGLMNEPNVQTPQDWLGSVNAAIAAIRGAGATSQTVLVPGTDWDSADSWLTSGNAAVIGQGVVDPANKYAFEVHQYLDSAGTGTVASAVSPTIGADRIAAITQWAETFGQKLFLGEFGAATDSTSLTALNNMLAYMSNHTDAWLGGTYWAAGNNQFFSIDPVNGVDKPQLDVLAGYAPGTAASIAGVTASSYTNGNVTTYADGSVETKYYATNGSLARDSLVEQNGSKTVQIFNIAGQSYTYELDVFNAQGVETTITRTHADNSLAFRYTLDVTTGNAMANQYTAAGLLITTSILQPDGTNETKTYAADGSTLIRDTIVQASGAKDVYSYNIAGASYVAEHDVFDANGNETAITRTHDDNTLAYTKTYNPATGATSTNQYTAAGLLSTTNTILSSGATDSLLYAANGSTLLRETKVNADGSKDVYSYGITAASYADEHDVFDANGNETAITRTLADGTITYSKTLSIATGTTVVSQYTTTGLLSTQTTAAKNGATEIKTYASNGSSLVEDYQVHADSSRDIYYAGISGQSYTAEHDVFDVSGNETAITRTHADGTVAYVKTFSVATGTTVVSQYTMTGLLSMQTTTARNGATEIKTYASNGTSLIEDYQLHADSSRDIYYTGIADKSYTAEHDVFDTNGNEIGITRTHVNGSPAYVLSYVPATGVKTIRQYTAAGVLSTATTITSNGTTDTKTYSSDGATITRESTTTANNVLTYFYSLDQVSGTKTTTQYTVAGLMTTASTNFADGSSDYRTYAANGTSLLRDTQTHADGSKDVYSYGITGTNYTSEHDTIDAQGNTVGISRSQANGITTYKYRYDPTTGTKVTDSYSAGVLMIEGTTFADQSTDTKTFAANGQTVLRDTQRHSDGTMDVYSYNILGQTYTAEHDELDATGKLEWVDRSNKDGTHTQNAYQAGQTLTSTANVADLFTSAGDDIFHLLSGSGNDTINSFHAGDASNHDTLWITGTQSAASFSDLMHNGMITTAGNDTLITLSNHNTVTLHGVAAHSLTASNFKFG